MNDYDPMRKIDGNSELTKALSEWNAKAELSFGPVNKSLLPNENVMDLKEAAKIILKYVGGVTYTRMSGYGSTAKCDCCGGCLNTGRYQGHEPDCELEQAKKLINSK